MPERINDFQGQSFQKLRRACLRRGALFKDPLFPATNQSLFYKREPPPGLTWKRPREICKDPRLFVDGISTRDLHQGSLGNCWMVAAISCLASEPSLWKKVIPDHMDQEWNPKRLDLYAGIFHFRFWRLGRWMDVVVDDRLPVSRDGVLLFCRSATPREFWSALLEKAYAKLNGCYEALEGGNTAEALIDFTGGVSEPFSLDREALSLNSDQRRSFFQTLAKVHERKSLITCSIRVRGGDGGVGFGVWARARTRLRYHSSEEGEAGERLLKTSGTSRLFMVRMRNPWGRRIGRASEQWQQLSRAEREKMGLIVRDVGEFWMDFEHFCHHFTDVVVCRLVDRTLLWPSSHWIEERCYGEWALMDKRSRCGGCINHRDTFLHNPQLFEVRGKEEEVLICLQQEDRRIRRKNGGGENLPIGFEVLKVEVNRCSRVQCVVEQAASSVYMDSRSVTLRATLTPGRYVVLPTTFLPGTTGRFLLRLLSHSNVKLRCVKCVFVQVRDGKCENDTIRTRVFKEEGNPEFNLRIIFYRRYPDTHISVELWSRGLLWDSLLREARLQTAESERSRSHVIDLRGGQSRSGFRGCIYVETSSSVCLTDL
uniref:Si:dkey-19b23.13 n=1 Tax=Amphiprion percula TaxID=161767 RepID=A0A3P8SIT5_AMPPE